MYGQRIKELRTLKGLTQGELAKLMNFKSASAIGMIEREERELSLDSLSKLATFFEVSTDFLLGKTDIDGGYLNLLFASKLKEKRRKGNLSIKDVANKIKISEDEVLAVENADLSIDLFFNYPDIAEFIGLTREDADNLMSYIYEKFDSKKASSDYINQISSDENLIERLDKNNIVQEPSSEYTTNNTPHYVEQLKAIPSEFINANDARAYINMHQIFGSEGFDSNKMSDDEILQFANELLAQMKMVSYKYKR